MAWSSAKAAGFVLTGVLKGDRELAQVRPQLADALAPDLAVWSGVFAPEQSEKSRILRELAATVRAPLRHANGLPVRARAWLAGRVERASGRTYLREAPAARAGFEPDAGLLAQLERLARAPGGGS